jgi:hypothetical protein
MICIPIRIMIAVCDIKSFFLKYLTIQFVLTSRTLAPAGGSADRERILDRINTEMKGTLYQGYTPLGIPCKN